MLPAWDEAELDAELSFSGTEPSSGGDEEGDEVALQVSRRARVTVEAIGLASWLLPESLSASGCVWAAGHRHVFMSCRSVVPAGADVRPLRNMPLASRHLSVFHLSAAGWRGRAC